MPTCKTCAQNIPDGAKKCTHCGSYQDWRRYLNFSSSVVSLLIALISVTALSIQHIQTAFEQDYSDLNVAVLKVDSGKISILASNFGNKSAAISLPELEVLDSRYGVTYYNMKVVGGNYIVDPGETKQIDLVFDHPNTQQWHKEWLQEGIDANNWMPDHGFETDGVLQLYLVQYSSLESVFKAQKKQRELRVENPDKAASTNDPHARPKDDMVMLEVPVLDVFPWLYEDYYKSMEMVTDTI